MTHVWIAQCLCPHRHAIMAVAGEADSEIAATRTILHRLVECVDLMLTTKAVNPWCHLCHAESDTWRYEVKRTRFATMAEAEPALKETEVAQIATAALIGPSKGRA